MKIRRNIRSERVWVADRSALYRRGWCEEIAGLADGAEMVELASLAQLLTLMQTATLRGTLVIESSLFHDWSSNISPMLLKRHDLVLVIYGEGTEPFSAQRLKRWNIRAVVPKCAELTLLRHRLGQVLSGRVANCSVASESAAQIDPEIDRISSQLASLTPREQAVLEQMVGGLLNKQIGFQLGIHESTVKHHLSSIYRKLQVPNRTRLAVLMRQISTPAVVPSDSLLAGAAA